MEELIQKDKDLFLYLNHLGNSNFDHFWTLVSEKWIWIPLYLIFLFILSKNFKLKSLIFILIFISIGITVSDQLAGIFKLGIERLRPCHDPSLENKIREVECGGLFGFYSSHASNAFFIATYLSILLRKKYGVFPYFLFFWAAMVSYSRIYLGVHFPLDVSFGALIGILLGGFFAQLTFKVIRRQK